MYLKLAHAIARVTSLGMSRLSANSIPLGTAGVALIQGQQVYRYAFQDVEGVRKQLNTEIPDVEATSGLFVRLVNCSTLNHGPRRMKS